MEAERGEPVGDSPRPVGVEASPLDEDMALERCDGDEGGRELRSGAIQTAIVYVEARANKHGVVWFS
jgi:hypothetical protein